MAPKARSAGGRLPPICSHYVRSPTISVAFPQGRNQPSRVVVKLRVLKVQSNDMCTDSLRRTRRALDRIDDSRFQTDRVKRAPDVPGRRVQTVEHIDDTKLSC